MDYAALEWHKWPVYWQPVSWYPDFIYSSDSRNMIGFKTETGIEYSPTQFNTTDATNKKNILINVIIYQQYLLLSFAH